MQQDLFISYAWKPHKDKVHEFNEKLKLKYTTWIDIEKMKQGDLNRMMREGIHNSSIFLCCLSEEYAKSTNCLKELKLAAHIKKPILFVVFDDIKGLKEDAVLRKFGEVDIFMAGQLYYKYTNQDGIEEAIDRILQNQQLIDPNESLVSNGAQVVRNEPFMKLRSVFIQTQMNQNFPVLYTALNCTGLALIGISLIVLESITKGKCVEKFGYGIFLGVAYLVTTIVNLILVMKRILWLFVLTQGLHIVSMMLYVIGLALTLVNVAAKNDGTYICREEININVSLFSLGSIAAFLSLAYLIFINCKLVRMRS